MTTDRITEIRVAGLRVFEQAQLSVRGLTVLIGDNGAGKSTLLEAFELLRGAGIGGSQFIDEVVHSGHGPFSELLRMGGSALSLGVTVEGDGPRLDYSFTVRPSGTGCAITEERLDVFEADGAPAPRPVLIRTPGSAKWFDAASQQYQPVGIASSALLAPAAATGLVVQEAFVRLVGALVSIECHPPLDVRPLWQQHELQVRVGPRWPSRPEPAERVRRYGYELPAALLVLRNRGGETWNRFLRRARAAVGTDLVDLSLEPAGAGQLDALLKFRAPRAALPLRLLSEGQLSFVTMMAAVELGDARSVLVLDEPDMHLHPELTVNLVQALEDLAETCPVVLATHSDRLLDALLAPADSVVLCELDAHGAGQLRRPNPAALASWLERYQGLGRVRAEGYEAHVFDADLAAGNGASGERPG